MANPLASFWKLVGSTYTEVLFAINGGSADAGKPGVLDQNGQWPIAMMPATYAPNVDSFTATEAIPKGNFVTLVTDPVTGVTTMKNAVANSPVNRAYGHVKVQVAANTVGTVYMLPDKNDAVTLDPTKCGDQYLSTTIPGGTQNTPPTGAGVLSQYLGYATSPTTIHTVCYPASVLAQ